MGEAAGLATSLLWTVSSVSFTAAGRRLGSSRLNLIRSVLAMVILAGLLAAATGMPWPQLEARPALLLAASGIVGLAIGDQFLFAAFVHLGPRRSMLIMTLSPVAAALMGLITLGERLSLLGVLGMAATLGGVAWVILERRGGAPEAGGGDGGGGDAADAPQSAAAPAARTGPVLCAVMGALCQAGGMVLAKHAMGADATPVDWLGFQTVRMSAGAGALLLLAAIRVSIGSRGEAVASHPWPAAGRERRVALAALLCGTLAGPVTGVFGSLVAISRCEVAVATTLMSLTPIFLLPVARVVDRERIDARAILGALLAVAGVALLALRTRPPEGML